MKMALVYREDPDLEILKNCINEELEVLETILIKDKNGTPRMTEKLTYEERYQKHFPNRKKYWDLIMAEYQTFGGNTFANILRGGKGVLYKEILVEVAKVLKVPFHPEQDTTTIEEYLLKTIIKKSLENLSEKELKKILSEMNINVKGNAPGKKALIIAIQTSLKAGGFATYQFAVIVANIVAKQIIGKGLSFTANALLTKWLSVLINPFATIVMAIWTAIDIAGPAYRVTIPATIYIAALRQIYLNKEYLNKEN